MHLKFTRFIMFLAIAGVYSCSGNSGKTTNYVLYKGVYSSGPEVKSFEDCDTGGDLWVTDNSEQLELKYAQLNFEKPYVPVYVEVEGIKVPSGKEGLGSQYDSTLVVKKLIKITKEIPQDMCN